MDQTTHALLAKYQENLVQTWSALPELPEVLEQFGYSVRSISALAGGEVHQTYRVDAFDRVTPLVARCAVNEVAAFEKESLILRALRSRGLNVPNVILTGCFVSDQMDVSLCLEDYIAGPSLKGSSVSGGASAQPWELERMVRVLRDLHSVDVSALQNLMADAPRNWQEWVDVLLPVREYGCSATCGVLEESRCRYLDCGGEVTIVHGDPKPEHFIAGTSGGTYILDFEDSGVGDPAFDIAWLGFHLDLGGEAENICRDYEDLGFRDFYFRYAVCTPQISHGLQRYYREKRHPLVDYAARRFDEAAALLSEFPL